MVILNRDLARLRLGVDSCGRFRGGAGGYSPGGRKFLGSN
jgi:hypothetical protein